MSHLTVKHSRVGGRDIPNREAGIEFDGPVSAWIYPHSPQSSERVVRHARARIPNDVRVREADYFDGSRAPESQGQKGSELATTENPKGEQTNLITKRACLIAKRACAEPDAHFVEILSQERDQSASETDEHSCHFKPNE